MDRRENEQQPISYEEAQEAWYQANLDGARKIALAEKRINELEVYKQTLPGLRPNLLKGTREQLLAALQYNSRVHRQAKSWTKTAIVEWMIADRVATVEQNISGLRAMIADNQPDPRWRLRAGDSLELEEQAHE